MPTKLELMEMQAGRSSHTGHYNFIRNVNDLKGALRPVSSLDKCPKEM